MQRKKAFNTVRIQLWVRILALAGAIALLAAPVVAAKETTGGTFKSLLNVRTWTTVDTSTVSRLELEAATNADVTLSRAEGGIWPDALKLLIYIPDTSTHFDLFREEFRGCLQMAMVAQARPERYDFHVQLWVDPEDITYTDSKKRATIKLDDGYISCRLILID